MNQFSTVATGHLREKTTTLRTIDSGQSGVSLRLFQEKSTWWRSSENTLLEEASLVLLLLLQGVTDREWRMMAPAERVRSKRKVASLVLLLLLQGVTGREWRMMAPTEKVRRKRKVAFKLGTRASMLDLHFVG